jgi:phosphoglycolate phosphatase
VGRVPRLVAFDLDGTLIDSKRDLAESVTQMVEERGGRALSVTEVAAMIGEGAALLVQRALAASGLPPDPSALPRFLDVYGSRLLNHTTLYPGMREAVETARRGGARVTVLTNKPLAPSERILAALEIRHLFDDVVGGDGPHGRKPDPAGLLAMMADAGAGPAATLLVGDTAFDHETARRAGARCCLVSFGYSPHGVPPERLTADDWPAADAAAVSALIARFTAA